MGRVSNNKTIHSKHYSLNLMRKQIMQSNNEVTFAKDFESKTQQLDDSNLLL